MNTRNWSIRSKIVAMVTPPLTALFALWIFATVITAGPALNLLNAQTLLDTVGNPTKVLIGELQRERRATVVYLSDASASPQALNTQRAATDRAAAEFRKGAGSTAAHDAATDTLRSRITQMFGDLDALGGNRSKYVDTRVMDPVAAQGLFNSMVDTGFQLASATASYGDDAIDRQVRALITVGRGQEYLSRVDSLMRGAVVAGQITADSRGEMLTDIGTSQLMLTDGVADLPVAERTAFQAFNTGAAFARVRRMESTLLIDASAGAPSPVTADQWQPAYDQSVQQLWAFEENSFTALAQRATPVALQMLIRLGAAGLLGLIALVVSLIVSIKVGRSVVGRLHRLRIEALEMAGQRLPTVVRRLQRGETVDVDVETPPLKYGQDEIGEVGRAFNEVQRTAVQSAVDEAKVRRGINEVFLNIARRSQTLLHRQLALLDRMERREAEPTELEDLYRVDHLATRMRRHAEDLVILAGSAPGRGWRNPVPVIDVIRGAISEVEDYKRIDIRSIESAAILGRAVGDIIHLLAELLENAASFSPPQTRVLVEGQVLPNGYAIEIEDRGLGMSPDAIEDANRRLLEPPDFDPTDSARLGLFVVAQLTARHGIRVSLRQSAYGGVTAIVLVPAELITPIGGPLELPAGPAPANKSWDRPLVGTGTDDPSRHSLAALQWQGTEELRSVTAVAPRPITLNGSAHAAPHTQELRFARGPSPSAVVDGLTPDGLVQRRRTKPRQEQSALAPEPLPAGLESPEQLLQRPAQPFSASPAQPVSGPPIRPVSGPAGRPRPTTLGDSLPLAEDGLPRRVRQGSLAPQLRAPAADPPSAPTRAPEQVRSIMSALQSGTNRGRLAAAAGHATGEPPESAGAGAFAEAATVIFPAIRDSDGPAGTEGSPGGDEGAGAAGGPKTIDAAEGPAAHRNQLNRPEKDA
jgi:signal transduction histidine kinase